jgi:elongation factor G
VESDRHRLHAELSKLAQGDSSLEIAIGGLSGQTILKGASEEHLAAALDRLENVCKIDVAVGQPQVAYRETLIKRVEVDHTHKRRLGGAGEFARVKMVFEPAGPDAGSSFAIKIADDVLPIDYVHAVERGFNAALSSGPIAGFPMVDVTAILIDGAYHDRDSSIMVFEIVGHRACREALRKNGVLLEPIMKVEATTPEDYAGSVKRDLRARRGRLEGQAVYADAVVIHALVPFANMFGYRNSLKALTQGRAEMRFDHYAAVDIPDDDGPFRPAIGMRA